MVHECHAPTSSSAVLGRFFMLHGLRLSRAMHCEVFSVILRKKTAKMLLKVSLCWLFFAANRSGLGFCSVFLSCCAEAQFNSTHSHRRQEKNLNFLIFKILRNFRNKTQKFPLQGKSNFEFNTTVTKESKFKFKFSV